MQCRINWAGPTIRQGEIAASGSRCWVGRARSDGEVLEDRAMCATGLLVPLKFTFATHNPVVVAAAAAAATSTKDPRAVHNSVNKTEECGERLGSMSV